MYIKMCTQTFQALKWLKKTTDLLTTSFQPSSLFWPLLGLVRLSLLLGEVTGRAIDLNGEGRELEVESTMSGVL